MPDSGQVLSSNGAIHRIKGGDISFEFADDGWGNPGRGRIRLHGDKADLTLRQTAWPEEGNRNISRNYGHFVLQKGPCDSD